MTLPNNRRWLLATAGLLGLCALLALWPTGTAQLEWSRDLIAHGQVWRLWTAHLTHFHFNQWFWDGAMFALLIYLARPFVPGSDVCRLCLISAPIIAISVFSQDSISIYRGLSGIDMALAVFVWARSRSQFAHSRTWLVVGGLIGAKLVAECAGISLFVHGESVYQPLALAHVSGSLTGFVMGFWPWLKRLHPGTF
ncbi:MAG: rhombosortase [Acidobacteria bacterium]|nr:rhombosortase [Acidobacteriota bacterium]